MLNLRGAAPFDRGRRAALNGKPKSANPFDLMDSQGKASTITIERKASEWDEGWWVGYCEKLEKKVNM